ncbi:dTMP kinase [Aminobacterium mobile]|uniref:dTMP kinase n=1 Tax=Aminobacterium mobile TaxID=81467 RepID=UPI0004662039|nr:dTMP kinase [Aminobacterium mobile]
MFITLEGIDGCGKSTQAAILNEKIAASTGKNVFWTREPGGWAQGGLIRSLLLEEDLYHPLSELFLFVIDRCEHVRQEIVPALSRGDIVVCERYSDSTRAYQIWGRGIPEEKVETLFSWCEFPEPDLTLWMDVPLEMAFARIESSRSSLDRIESGTKSFLERVCRGYEELALRYPKRIVRIDGTQSLENVANQIWNSLEVFLNQ